MLFHFQLGGSPFGIKRKLWLLIQNGNVALGGNSQLKIYGKLNCASGKRMKITNRVFFSSAAEAVAAGYRPCGNCMREAYQTWKAGT